MRLIHRIAIAAIAGAAAGYGLARGGWAPWVTNNFGIGTLFDVKATDTALSVLAVWSALGMGGLAAALCAIFGRDDS